MSEEPFSKQMRKATRNVHAISDALVNGKLLFALSDTQVWAEGLQVFYEIFKFLETTAEKMPESKVAQIYVPEMKRRQEFERDLVYYLGPNWKKNYKIRQSVMDYLNHLEELQRNNPDLLIVYTYHLYLGLLSGGQILGKKMKLMNKLNFKTKNFSEGYSVTSFEDMDIKAIKNGIISRLNNMASEWNEQKSWLC